MKRDVRIAFTVPLLAAAVLRLAVAARFVFRPDGWNAFEPDNRNWELIEKITGTAAGPVAAVALIVFAIWRLYTAARRWPVAWAIALSLVCSVALFYAGIGEPYLRLILHKARYDAIVAQRPDVPLIVFDWGETATFYGRTLEYLVFARGDQVTLLNKFQANDNGGDEPVIQEDEMEIRSLLSDAWDNPASRGPRFRILVLDNCRMQVHRLTGGYFYIVDAC